MPNPRELTDRERAFVERMLSIAGLSNSSFAKQVSTLHVVDQCDCGCPSVDFMPSPTGHSAVDAYARTRDGGLVGAILWQKDGRIAGLEVHSIEADPTELPDPHTLSIDGDDDAG